MLTYILTYVPYITRGVIDDLQGLKRGDGHLGYRTYIGIGFAPDNNLRIHGAHGLSGYWVL